MHDPAEIRATVDAYVALRARIEEGEATWLDLAEFFTDDAVYIDPAWGRIQGIDGDPRLPRRQHARARGLALPPAPRPPSRATTS